jgi:hypothetical protein
MPKDHRYTAVKVLIESGHIKIFKQIFDYIPVSVVSNSYGSNYTRFVRLIRNPSQFKLKDLVILASLFDVDSMKMIELVFNQHKTV